MLIFTAVTLLAISPPPVLAIAPADQPVDQATVTAPPPQDAPSRAEAPRDAAAHPSPGDQEAPGRVREDVLVTARRNGGDPLHGVNVKAFDATEAVDRAVVGPVSMAYKHTIPRPVRSGIHNFLYNLREPLVFVNFVLQLKPGKAAETVGRFAVNSTVGIAGVVDVARGRPFHLPRRANGFADTLGFYGVKNGPFLFLPITGPTTVRDLIGGTLDRLLLPLAVGKPFTSTAFTVPVGAVGVLDHRADFDPTIRKLHDGVADPYASTRTFYLARRQAEIDHLHGRGDGSSSPMGEAPVDAVDPIPLPDTSGRTPAKANAKVAR
ncbi:MAG: MlaA family lipoprotein [Janthinobacterium lividum]